METPFSEQVLLDAFDEAGVDPEEIDVRPDYSGRGMFGSTCFGIVSDESPAIVGLVIGIAVEAGGGDWIDAVDIVRDARNDSMGLSTITYFPRWTLGGEEG